MQKTAFPHAYNTGRVKTATDVQGQETTYSYNSAGDLTTVYLPSGEKVTYTYDSYHNVKSATTAEGIKYTYTYDTYGNNLSVSIGSTITSYATYTSDGNRLATTKDAAGKITTYQYNADTNVLEWVQYPKDTDGTNNSVDTRTHYTYDKMYRLEKVTAATDTGLALSAGYTYSEDMLTSIATPSTTYSFVYGNFGLRSNVQVGSQSLAKYYYESGTNRLIELEYGNSDVVQYTYNTQGWLTKQTYYENGSTTVDATVTYLYDNDGALASVIDSASGITTKYYYDFAGRLVRCTESNDSNTATDSDDHAVAYTYDDKSQLTKKQETTFGTTWTTVYAYDEDGRMTSSTQGTVIRSFTYGTKNRLLSMTLQRDGATALTTAYAYKSNTAMVGTITLTNKAGETGGWAYTYDNNGNITAVKVTNPDGTTRTTKYTYDSANQLVREDNPKTGLTTLWTYDNAGNILSEKVYVYTTGTPSELLETNTYTYGNANWGDLLTKYNGQTISYDNIGNPTSYYNGTRWAMTWEHGRQLATMSDTSTSTVWTNTYNSDGLRTSRTDGTTTYTYYYEGGRLSAIKRNDLNMWIIYDENGPVTLKYGSGTFHYVTNLQGDVVAIVGNQGQTLVEYTYDAWGKVLSITGDYAYNLGIHNPILYRGYIYDHETGLYYCQSRYYDPETGRFLNADGYTATGQGFAGNNMFAYCRNNPVCRVDVSGTADSIAYNDGELLSNDELDGRHGGGGSSSISYESFKGFQSSTSSSNCTVYGSGHGNAEHANYINNLMNDLVHSGDYAKVYGNRALSTAGLNGSQRPDVIAVHNDGTVRAWEVASPSQAYGTSGYRALEAKIKDMQAANPSVMFHQIIPWEAYHN